MGRHIRLVRTLRPGAGADASEQRIADRLRRVARGRCDAATRESPGVALQIRDLLDALTVRQHEGLLRRHKEPGALVVAARDILFERITLTAVFLTQIPDQTREEDPKRIKHHLCDIDISNQRPGHIRPSSVERFRRPQPGSSANPKRMSCR